MALLALGVGKGDEVIVPECSWIASAAPITYVGAQPVFADIDPVTFNVDARAAVERVTSRTKAIMPVHLFGRCAKMDPVLEVAEAHGIAVIEDAAQALGASDEKGRKAGMIGLMGCFSFFPSKNLGAFGDGGMLITNDEALAEALRVVRVHGAKPKYHHRILGGNFRLDALQAAVLRVKLKRLQTWTDRRRTNAERYRTLFRETGLLEQVFLPGDVPGHIYNQFVIRVHDRDRLQAFLRERDVGTEVYYPVPLHLQECFRDFGYRNGDFPHAEDAAQTSLGLPIYPELTEAQQRYVVSQVDAFYER